MKALIGITVDIEVAPKNGRLFSKCYQTYIDSVFRAGGIPYLIAPVNDPDYIAHVADQIDALVIPGGDDIDPRYLGKELYECERYVPVTRERFEFDRKLVHDVLLRRIPMLAVCYGAQLVNLMLGGDIIQDIPDMVPDAHRHQSDTAAEDHTHDLIIEEGSRLHKIFKGNKGRINSVHHQAVKTVGSGLKVTARAPDGIIEAIEAEDPKHYLLGLQWHPERCPFKEGGEDVFVDLVREASRSKSQRAGRISITGTDTI